MHYCKAGHQVTKGRCWTCYKIQHRQATSASYYRKRAAALVVSEMTIEELQTEFTRLAGDYDKQLCRLTTLRLTLKKLEVKIKDLEAASIVSDHRLREIQSTLESKGEEVPF